MGGIDCHRLSLSADTRAHCAWDLHFDSKGQNSAYAGGPSEFSPPQAPRGWWSSYFDDDRGEKVVSSWNAAASSRCIQTRFGEWCAGAFPLVPTLPSERPADHSNSVMVVKQSMPEREVGIRSIYTQDPGAMFITDPYSRPLRLSDQSLEMGVGIVFRVPLRWPF